MNKNLHRIVFNAARGQRMAVAETAASHSKASSGGNAGMATAVAFAAITMLAPAQAQIAADPSAPGNQRPTVLAAPNGVPVVNIQTPSVAGVSRNTYSQFDVNKAGAVLNNSRGNVQTQLGGWVQGNPWLATGSARVILNEVNSSSPSRLNGYVEVAGPRTEVIIANPAGIRVDGAGFINASRVTLTTGTPVVNAGNLESYRVQGGSVNISGAGLDTRGADLTAIYARAVEVNAGLWADYLRVTTGTNQIGASSGEPPSITPVEGTGARPAFALDIAALGGMYAGHIFLVGNEYGVGVNNQGTLAAGGKLVLQANGWLANAGTIQATGDVQVQTQGLTSSGTVYAGGNGSLISTGSIANTGLVAAQGSMTVQATGEGAGITSSQGGAFFSGVAPDGRLGGGGILSLEATSVIALHGQVSAGQIAITTGTLDTGGGLLTGGQLSIQAQRVSNAGGEIAQTGAADLNIQAGTIDNTAGRITTAGSLVASATLANGNGLQNAGGLIAANGSVTVTATRLNNAGGTIAAVQGNIALTATEGAINNDSGKIQAALDVSLGAKGVSNTTAAVAAQGAPAGSITGRNVLVNTGAMALNNQSGTIVATGTLDLDTGALNNASGYLGAAGNMKLSTSSAAITNTAGAQIVSQSTITITGNGLNNQAGQIQSVGDLTIDSGVGTADNTSGLLRSGGTTQLTAGVITNSVTSAVDQGIEGRTVSLAATTLANATGSIRADNSVTINASGVLDNTNGLISANKALTVQDSLARALALSNAGGTLIAGETASISAAGLTGAGKVLSKGTLDLDFAGGLNNAGEIIANGDLNLSSAADVVNTGKIQSGAALNLAARNVANAATGEISAVNTAITAGSTFTNRGLIDGIDTRVDAATLDNIGTGRIYGNHVSLYAAAVNNDAETVAGVTSAATIAARDRLDIGASVVNNREHALIFSAGDAFVGRSLDANRQATGQALAVNNASATIEALGQLGLNAADVNNTNNHFVMTKGAPKVEALTEVMYDAATGHVNAGQVFIYQQRQQPTNPNSYFNATLLSTYAREDGPDIYANMGDCWCEVGSGFTAEWSEYRFQRTTITDTVASSDPGRLLSGGAMSINGNLLNDKSQAIAGGTLGVVGVVAKNTDPDATTSTSDTGETRFHTFVKGNFHGIDFWTPWAPYTPATVVTKAVVPVSVFAANTTPVGSGLAIAGAGTTSVTTGIGAAGAASGSLRAVAITQVSLGGGGVIRTVGGSAGMPSASLFRQTPPSAGYLIETDPRFTSFGNWVSSDYLLSALGIDAAGLQKRLGDGFYEQRLVREQVAQLTGQRFLGNYASDDEQFKALMNAGATQAKAFNLRPGIALTQEQMAQLTSDIVWLVEQSVTLPDGSTARALVPQVYARVKAADLDGSGTLLAGKGVSIKLSGDLTNSGTIAGRQIVELTAENVNNLGGRIDGAAVTVQARNDLDNIGGQISAISKLDLAAGRDLNVTTTTQGGVQITGTAGYSSQGINRVAGLYVTGDKGLLIASAGRDLNLTAAQVASTGQDSATTLSAGRNVNLGTVQTATSEQVTWAASTFRKTAVTQDVGTQVQGSGSVSIRAGQDVNVTAATVQAGGKLDVAAVRDVKLAAGLQTVETESSTQSTRKGFLSKTTNTEYSRVTDKTAQGSSLGGQDVTVTAGRDIAVKGGSVIADKDLTMKAANNVTITAATNTRDTESDASEKRSGVFGSGGIGFTIGSRQQSTDTTVTSSSAAASTVGAIAGNVTIRAGNTYRQTGSDVVAPAGDVDIRGKQVLIDEARETSTTLTEQKSRQSGLTIAVTSPVISAVQTVGAMAKAAGNTSDGRMQALAGASAALAVWNAGNPIKDGQGVDFGNKSNQIVTRGEDGTLTGRDATAADKAGGMNVAISLGGSKSQSTRTTTSDTARGSSIAAGGSVRIQATGAGDDSNVVIQGSSVKAGDIVDLQADNKVQLLAATNTASQASQDKSSSGSIGISMGSSGFGVTVSASQGRGNADGNDVSHTNTQIQGRQVSIKSGGDTDIKGAVVTGDRVKADVGGNLNVESLQDTSKYKESSKSAGGSLTVGAGVSGSISASKTNIDSNYASVLEQSGIRAGDGGFQVNVQGKTDLKGGAITSTQKAVDDGVNVFDSKGGITTSDVENTASYSAKAMGINLGSGTSLDGKLTPQGTSAGIGSDKGSAASTTQAAISGIAGNKDARTGDKETGIKPIFDQQKTRDEVNAQVAITAEFQRASVPIAARFADAKAIELRREGKEDEARKWDEGGAFRTTMYAALGGLVGGVGGATGAVASSALVPTIGEQIAGMNLGEPVRHALTELMGTAIGVLAGGSAGAVTALPQTALNYVSHSPFATVRRTVSQENARLLNACALNCTLSDLRNIDLQMQSLEAAANLAQIGVNGGLTGQQARQLSQLLVELLPVYGSAESTLQLVTGRSSLSGEETSRFWAAVGVVPLAGGMVRKIGEPAADVMTALLRGGETIKPLGAKGGMVADVTDDVATVATRSSGGAAAQTLGATREQVVADAVGGARSGEIIKTTRGRTDVDVVDPAGNLIAVGGAAKADNLGNFVRGLMVYSETASARGVSAYFYYAAGTPQTVIDAATKVLGSGFVKPIP